MNLTIKTRRRCFGRPARLLCTVAIAVCCLAACKHEDIRLKKPNEDVSSLAGYLSNNFDYTLFSAALEYTHLADSLNEGGPYTVLAPDNQAFNELGIFRPSDFEQLDPDSLKSILAYHILPYRLMEQDIPLGSDIVYRTLDQREVKVSRVQWTAEENGQKMAVSNLYFAGAFADVRDKVLSNGVLFALDRVMKTFPGKSVQDWLSEHDQYQVLVAGLKHFGLWEDLAGPGPFTLFAPRDEVFEAAGMTLASIAAMDANQYIGARLFGAYIMYDRSYFINDWEYFYRFSQSQWLAVPLRNDTGYKQYFMGRRGYEDPEKTPTTLLNTDQYRSAYSLGISMEEAPYNYAFVNRSTYRYKDRYFAGWDEAYFLGSGTEGFVENQGLYRARNDNMCENGIIHDLSAVLVLPEEAEKGAN